jgi:MFS family permease
VGAEDAGRRGGREGVSSSASLFSDRNYAIYALGNTISSLGMWAQRVGVGWLSWDLSHSASWVGLVSLSQFLPLIVFAPIFGSVLDRYDPKRYAMVTNAVLTALATALWIVTAAGAMTIERLCLLSVLLGVANGAYHPVRLSIVNEVAPPGRLAQAIATNSILYNLTRSVGPALAGVAIATLGIAATFAINAVSYAAIIGALAIITIREIPRRPTLGFVQDFTAGIRYAAGHRMIRDLLLLSMVTSILGRGVIELLPAFAGGLYDQGSSGLAALTTASGIGAVLGGVFLTRIGSGDQLPVIARRSAMWVGVAVVVLGLAPGYGFAIAAVFLLNIATLICGVGLQVVLQKSLDESFRGRVLGLWGMCNVAGPGIGGALIGGAAHGLGLRGAAVASGVICSALALWIVQGGHHAASKPA